MEQDNPLEEISGGFNLSQSEKSLNQQHSVQDNYHEMALKMQEETLLRQGLQVKMQIQDLKYHKFLIQNQLKSIQKERSSSRNSGQEDAIVPIQLLKREQSQGILPQQAIDDHNQPQYHSIRLNRISNLLSKAKQNKDKPLQPLEEKFETGPIKGIPLIDGKLKDEINSYIKDVRGCLSRMKSKEVQIVKKLDKRSKQSAVIPRQIKKDQNQSGHKKSASKLSTTEFKSGKKKICQTWDNDQDVVINLIINKKVKQTSSNQELKSFFGNIQQRQTITEMPEYCSKRLFTQKQSMVQPCSNSFLATQPQTDQHSEKKPKHESTGKNKKWQHFKMMTTQSPSSSAFDQTQEFHERRATDRGESVRNKKPSKTLSTFVQKKKTAKQPLKPPDDLKNKVTALNLQFEEETLKQKAHIPIDSEEWLNHFSEKIHKYIVTSPSKNIKQRLFFSSYSTQKLDWQQKIELSRNILGERQKTSDNPQ